MPQPKESSLGPWRPLSVGEIGAQLFVIGDVHGQAAALNAALDHIAAIPRSADLRRLVFLGDIIDRGPQNLSSINMVLTAEMRALVDDVILLPGNHELMLLDALADPARYMGDWLDNGGDTVIAEARANRPIRLLNDFAEVAKRLVPAEFIAAIQAAPSHLLAERLLLVHAGLDPTEDTAKFLGMPAYAAAGRHWAWIRQPFLDWRSGWGPQGEWLVVHGHTPAVRRHVGHSRFRAAANRVRTHYRICLDAGAAYGLGQVGWAEFGRRGFRIGLACK